MDVVASEYVNTNLRMGFKRWQRIPENYGKTDYKLDFRPTQAFRNCRDVAYAELEQILKASFRKPDDFNDAYFVSYCALNNLILVTDDRDMFDTPLDVRILTK